VLDHVTHLAYFDEAATRAATDPARFQAEADALMAGGDDFPDQIAARFRGLPGDEAFAWLCQARREYVGVVAALSDFGIRMFIFGGSRRDDSNGGNNPITLILAIVVIVLAPLMATLMQLAVSRKRESLADVSAVEMTRYPPGLISALEKLRDDRTVTKVSSRATAHLWIEEPMDHYQGDDKKKSRWSHLFDTHPPLEDRIAALREM
jgi:Zn-dependent protease with chaperone function